MTSQPPHTVHRMARGNAFMQGLGRQVRGMQVRNTPRDVETVTLVDVRCSKNKVVRVVR